MAILRGVFQRTIARPYSAGPAPLGVQQDRQELRVIRGYLLMKASVLLEEK
jgi:hypothetical protein